MCLKKIIPKRKKSGKKKTKKKRKSGNTSLACGKERDKKQISDYTGEAFRRKEVMPLSCHCLYLLPDKNFQIKCARV